MSIPGDDLCKESKNERFERLEAERLANRRSCGFLVQSGFPSVVGWQPPKFCEHTALINGRCRKHAWAAATLGRV